MIQRFNEFQRMFKGDPKEEVMKLVQSGKISQEQLNQLQMQAREIQQMLNQMK